MKLILHIGTEKTATTTLQHFLYHNRKALLAQRIALLSTLDQPCNRKLAAYCQPEHMCDDYFTDMNINSAEERQKLFESFTEDLGADISKARKKADVLIITCEHFHSRLRTITSIKKLHNLITPYFVEIEIVCYFREQSSLALSSYSTATKFGDAIGFDEFLRRYVTPKDPYYNYDELLTKWAKVFGREPLRPILYGYEHFTDGDIRRDFLRRVKKDIDFDPLDFEMSDRNKSLGWAGLELAQINNDFNSRYMQDGSRNMLREIVHTAIQDSSISSTGKPPFSQALDIHRAFEESNKSFAAKFLGKAGNPFPIPANTAKKPPREIQLNLEQVKELMRNLMSGITGKNTPQIKSIEHSLSYPESENYRLEANRAMLSNDSNKAQALFKKAIITCDNFMVYRDYSAFLRKQGDYQKAMEMCQAAIDLRPDRPWLKKLMQSIINDATD